MPQSPHKKRKGKNMSTVPTPKRPKTKWEKKKQNCGHPPPPPATDRPSEQNRVPGARRRHGEVLALVAPQRAEAQPEERLAARLGAARRGAARAVQTSGRKPEKYGRADLPMYIYIWSRVPCCYPPPPPYGMGPPGPPPGSCHLRSHPHPDPLNSHPDTPTPRHPDTPTPRTP